LCAYAAEDATDKIQALRIKALRVLAFGM